MTEPRVANVRHLTPSMMESGEYVMVDRSTRYGNPFIIGPDGDREAVIVKYERWIMRDSQANLRMKIRLRLRGKILVCHCAPLPCHADILLRIAND